MGGSHVLNNTSNFYIMLQLYANVYFIDWDIVV